MGKFTSYSLSAWGPDGRFLSASEKESLQDWVLDEGVTDLGCDHGDDGPFVMSFCDMSLFAYERVERALSGFAGIHPDLLIELEYNCDDDDCHQLIRFKGNDQEEVDRVEYYPAFRRLTMKGVDTK